MEKLIKSFIKMILEGEEVRVPTQLLSPKEDEDNNEQMDKRYRDDRSRERGKSKNGEEDEVEEFCAVSGGGIAGMSLPMGAFVGVPSAKKQHKKKKKS